MAKRMTILVSKGRMMGRKNGETLEREGRLKVEECSPVGNDQVGVRQVRHEGSEDDFWRSEPEGLRAVGCQGRETPGRKPRGQ